MPSIVKHNRIKGIVAQAGYRTGEDLYQHLDRVILLELRRALTGIRGTGRRTVRVEQVSRGRELEKDFGPEILLDFGPNGRMIQPRRRETKGKDDPGACQLGLYKDNGNGQGRVRRRKTVQRGRKGSDTPRRRSSGKRKKPRAKA